MKENRTEIIFINMASGFGGGEYQTVELIKGLHNFKCYFFGKKNSLISQNLKNLGVPVISFLYFFYLAFSRKNIILHAQDGRGAHIALFFKFLFRKKILITRHVNYPLKRKFSIITYKNADFVVGVSKKISSYISKFNPNTKTIYGCIKPLRENINIEEKYFNAKNTLSIAHIGNLQKVKNFELTIELAKKLPNINFYIVGSGELEIYLKKISKELKNITFIPFTEYIGSIFKNIDIQIVPSHSEGLSTVILEGYQYGVPVIAHSVGGIPEIVIDNKTGVLIENNVVDNYLNAINELLSNNLLYKIKDNIFTYIKDNDFSSKRMSLEYAEIYNNLLNSN